jgi:hypothetical protein
MISVLVNNVHLYSCTQLPHSFMQIFFTTNWICDLIIFKNEVFFGTNISQTHREKLFSLSFSFLKFIFRAPVYLTMQKIRSID